MKLLLKPTAVFAALLVVSLSAEAAQTPAVQTLPAAPAKAMATVTAPSVVSIRTPLSREELAKYEQKDAQYQSTRAAGASDSQDWWLIGGVVVAVGVVILVAGGGHGGSGGGGY
jgi:hypothetical protein